MLETFLHVFLYGAIGFTYFGGECTHLAHVYFAQEDGDGHDDKNYQGKAIVHVAQIEECCAKLNQCHKYLGNGIAYGIGYDLYIALHAIEHVACMVFLLAHPNGAHEVIEQTVAHVVLQLNLIERHEAALVGPKYALEAEGED